MRFIFWGAICALLSACQIALPSLKGEPRFASNVTRGNTLPFGTLKVACETPKKDMGKRVDQFPRKGRAVWRLYDTDPTSTTQRTQYITGFEDGCARQVTASLVVFGAPSLHEVHRYSKARAKAPWTKADTKYEALKSKLCGVGRKKPCPPNKLRALERNMAFVSVYKQFGDTDDWMELLLHDGAVVTEELH